MSSLEYDINLLRFQNKKLSERLSTRVRTEDDLRKRIEQLENKQTSAEAIVYVINRYWNQLNEDLRILLQRFDAETSDEQESSNENEATTSFISQLSNWDKEELEENLQQRVEVSKRAVSKVLQAFDRIVQRNEKITFALKEANETENGDKNSSLDEAVKKANVQLQNENKNLNALVTSLHEKHHKMSLKSSELKDTVEILEARNDELKLRIDDFEFELNKSRSKETRLQESLQELRDKMRDLQENSGEALVDISTNSIGSSVKGTRSKSRNALSDAKLEDLQRELEEYKELANNRLNELEALNVTHKDAVKLVEKLKMDLQCLPESAVVETPEYKCLQSHFSVLYNESMQLKTQLEDARATMQKAKNDHLRQIEHMESEELSMQKRLRTETIQLEDQLAQSRKEYEMLRLEFEQSLAATEQTQPLNREMRNLITSLQNHNNQLKGEVARYKKRLKIQQDEYNKVKQQLDQLTASNEKNAALKREIKQEPLDGPELAAKRQRTDFEHDGQGNVIIKAGEMLHKRPMENCIDNQFNSNDVGGNQLNCPSNSTSNNNIVASVNQPSTGQSSSAPSQQLSNHYIKKEDSHLHLASHHSHSSSHHQHDPCESLNTSQQSSHDKSEVRKIPEYESIIRDLKTQLKKSSEQNRELKLLLDAHKSTPKEQRDKAVLIASERKYRIEVEELKKLLAKHQEESRKDRKKLADEEATREINKLKETVSHLQKSLASQKQEDEALLNEMEVTGSAFEDMQEQNVRLLQQLREKDEANFKLMSERIKSQQIQQLLKEEKESLTEQVMALTGQVEAQNQVVRKLEEKERLLQNNLSTIEKELSLKQQAMELHRRKAIESAQSAADLKLHLDKYKAQLTEAQSSVAEKTSNLQQEAFKNQRLSEELLSWKRQYERAKKFELATNAEEVLHEEIKEYKTYLTCPSCKTNRKDAVLTKCFHVFCFDCLKTRLETRQRKCPKCNAQFGANDFHRLYLG